MIRVLRRLISRVYAERDRLLRRRLGAAGEKPCWMALDLGQGRGAPDPGAGAVRPYFVGADELLGAAASFWLSRDAAERIVAGGDRVCALRLDGEVVYRVVVTSEAARVKEVLALRGVTGRAWIVSGGLAHPAHRGRGLHGVAMAWVAAEARRAGAELLVAWVAGWNRSSLRAQARAGFELLPGPPEPSVRAGR